MHALSPDELFGNLYKHGTNEEKQLLDYLILLVDQSPNYLDSPADNILYDSIPFYIIDTVVDNDLIIANENLTKKLLNKIFSTGKVLDKNIIGYDSDCEKMIYKMDITYEILKCIENSERNITLNDICSELEKKSYIPKLFKK